LSFIFSLFERSRPPLSGRDPNKYCAAAEGSPWGGFSNNSKKRHYDRDDELGEEDVLPKSKEAKNLASSSSSFSSS
jgi:hypothetical protein